jgi:hypothetical protein
MVFFVVASLTAGALAQTPTAPDAQTLPQAGDRYRFNPVDGGVLRLDSQNGQVSFCRARPGGWSCETVADDRAALEAEIKRLSDRVAALERQSNDPVNRFRTPSDQEIEQVMGFFEKMMKRFRGVVENLKKEWEAETPNKG